MIIEVLSPSTAEVDRREKAAAYAASPTLHQYVLVDPDRRSIEVASARDGRLTWEAVGPGDVVSTPFGVLNVDAIHDQPTRPPQPDTSPHHEVRAGHATRAVAGSSPCRRRLFALRIAFERHD